MLKEIEISLGVEYATLGQKIYFEAVVLPELNEVLRKHYENLNELGEREEKR